MGNDLAIVAKRGIMGFLKGRWFVETLNIALPASLKEFIQARVAEGRYDSVSDYVRDLVQADQKQRHEERIDALLLEGLNSGAPIEVTKEYWEQKRHDLAARLARGQGS